MRQVQMDVMYRLMEQYLETEGRGENSSMFNSRRSALRPVWFWLSMMNVFRYTAIR